MTVYTDPPGYCSETGSWSPLEAAIHGHVFSETYKRKPNHTCNGTSWVCSGSILSKTYPLELMTYFSNFYPKASLSGRKNKTKPAQYSQPYKPLAITEELGHT